MAQIPVPCRLVLLAAAVLCGGFVALLGGGFSRDVEPESYGAIDTMFWFLLALFFAAPVWLPAIVPERYPVALKIVRRVGAAALLLPIYMFGGVVLHSINRGMSGLGISSSALAQGLVLTLLCVGCLSILLWPEYRSDAKRAF